MSTEELLWPRIRVKADYPGNSQSVGAIIQLYKETNRLVIEQLHFYRKYPHLFEELAWWQERNREEMPEYVKYSRGVYKVKNWHYSPGGEILFDILNWKNEKWWSSQGGNYWMRHVGLLPATLEEYNQYQSSIKHL